MARIRVTVSDAQNSAINRSDRTQVTVTAGSTGETIPVYPQVIYGVGSPPEDGDFGPCDIFIDTVTGNLFTWNG